MEDISLRDAEVSGKRILVVDDSVDSARMLTRSLKIEGHTGHAVYDGASALAAVRALRPDVVFLDLSLPDMSGEAVAAEIRASSDISATVLIALSGHQLEGPAARLFNDHLMKPVDVETILKLIQKVDTSQG